MIITQVWHTLGVLKRYYYDKYIDKEIYEHTYKHIHSNILTKPYDLKSILRVPRNPQLVETKGKILATDKITQNELNTIKTILT